MEDFLGFDSGGGLAHDNMLMVFGEASALGGVLWVLYSYDFCSHFLCRE